MTDISVAGTRLWPWISGMWATLWDAQALLGRRVRNPVVLIQLTTHTHSHWTSDTVANTHWLLTASVIMREAKVNVRVIWTTFCLFTYPHLINTILTQQYLPLFKGVLPEQNKKRFSKTCFRVFWPLCWSPWSYQQQWQKSAGTLARCRDTLGLLIWWWKTDIWQRWYDMIWYGFLFPKTVRSAAARQPP